ncbi:hypothetical protein PMAYCL1PPCAC_24867, partial [Pristionchus mayeri]
AQQRPNTIADYIRNLNGLARKIAGESASQSDITRFDKCILDLTANNCARLSKLIAHLCSESESDGYKFLAECAALFFRGLDESTVEGKEEARRFYLSSLLDHFCTRRVDQSAFVEISNLFTQQVTEIIASHFCTLSSYLHQKIFTYFKIDSLIRWYECISILIKRLRETTDREFQAYSQLVLSLLTRWLREASNITALASAVEIAQ